MSYDWDAMRRQEDEDYLDFIHSDRLIKAKKTPRVRNTKK